MSHPTPTRRPVPAVPLIALFFLGVITLGVLATSAPLLGLLDALLIAAALIVADLRGWSIR
ncbi:hypothetical protein [Microbacterium sp.]|jgi:hypothetical protein|uniref:hypothetical protein n=1 Tax=Microbacterium sp. TaxID=51671 RepID=UPI0037C68D56